MRGPTGGIFKYKSTYYVLWGVRMGFKCLFGHKWDKLGGLMNKSSGLFEQKYVCLRCRKVKYVRK